MSLTEVLDAVRVLSPKEQTEVRELLNALGAHQRMARFEKLRGSAKSDFKTLTLEDFKAERREAWKRLDE